MYNPIDILNNHNDLDLFDASKNPKAGLRPYVSFGEDNQFLEVTYSLIVKEPDVFKVNFEKIVDYGDGFASGFCVVPEYTWYNIHGLTDEDIKSYTEFIKRNVGTLMLLAREKK